MREKKHTASIVTGIVVTLALVALVPVTSQAQLRQRLELETEYLFESPVGAHRISIVATLGGLWGGRGQLTLDPNRCGFDEFGDMQGCTKIYFLPIEVQLTRIKPRGRIRAAYGRQLYEITGDRLTKRLILVVPASRGLEEYFRLVIMDADGHVEGVERLERQPAW